MAEPIGKGDWVECVSDRVPAGTPSPVRPAIVVGRVYQIDGLTEGYRCGRCQTYDHPGVHLVGIERHEPQGFAGCNFKPVYRPKAEIIEALKAPSPEVAPA